MSLNNRILIRDTYGSRGGTVDSQAAALPSTGSARSGATTDGDAIHLERNKQDLMKRSSSAGANANDKDERVPSRKSRVVLFLRSRFSQLP